MADENTQQAENGQTGEQLQLEDVSSDAIVIANAITLVADAIFALAAAAEKIAQTNAKMLEPDIDEDSTPPSPTGLDGPGTL